MANNSFAPTLWCSTPAKNDQPIKVGGINKGDHLITFSEAKLFFDDQNTIIYGYGNVTGNAKIADPKDPTKKIDGKIKTNWIDFGDEVKLIQVRLTSNKSNKSYSLFSDVIGKWLKSHYQDLAENECLVFSLKLNSLNDQVLQGINENLDSFEIDKGAGKFTLLNAFPTGVIKCEEDVLKGFKLDSEESLKDNNGYEKKPWNGGGGQTELQRLNDRLGFFLNLIYPKLTPEQIKEKNLQLAEYAKAFKNLEESEQEVVNLLMK